MTDDIEIGPVERSADGAALTVDLEVDAPRRQVYFNASEPVLQPNMEAFIALALLPAMKRRRDILARGPVSDLFLAGLEMIQDILRDWKPAYGKVTVRNIQPQAKRRPAPGRVGVFYSGGVDSLYTVLKRRDEISDLIFVHGFDLALEDRRGRAQGVRRAQQVAKHLGMRFVEIETNIKQFQEQFLAWGLTHGSALACIGHLLSPQFTRLYFPGSGIYLSLVPWGIHPLIDPLWSSEALDFFCDGYEATRIRKTAAIAQDDIALQNLRICMQDPGSGLNCGQCEKCVRTMLDLRIVGALDRFDLFEAPLDLGRVKRIYAKSGYQRVYLQKSLRYLEQFGSDLQLAHTLRGILDRPAIPKGWVKRLRKLQKKFTRA